MQKEILQCIIQCTLRNHRAPDKVRIFISKTSISGPNPMFDHLLESSHRGDSNKWSNIGFGQEIKEVASIEIHFTHLIWRSVKTGYLHGIQKRLPLS